MDNITFRICVALRLGCEMYNCMQQFMTSRVVVTGFSRLSLREAIGNDRTVFFTINSMEERAVNGLGPEIPVERIFDFNDYR